MVKIRYIAILSENPENLAGFYRRYLQMNVMGQSEHGDVSLTDGFYNLTLLKKRQALGEPRMEPGLHHIGCEVDNIAAVKDRYLKFNPRGVIAPEPGDVHHGEIRIYDPECTPVSLSEKGFGVKREELMPRIRHVAYNALDPETMLLFYSQVLGLRELPTSAVRRKEGRLNRFAGDGATNLAIHPFYSEVEGHEPRFGINHVGFLVRDLGKTMEDLAGAAAVKSRPVNRPYAEFRFRDPEGNALDLSQAKGWEVDIDKWERAA